MNLPISVHIDDGSQEWKPKNTFYQTQLACDFKEDLASSLAETQKRVNPLKDNTFIMSANMINLFIFNYFPLPAIETLLQFGKRSRNSSCSISNMASSRVHKWVFQGKQTHWITMSQGRQDAMIALTSMADTAKITLSGDANVYPDFKRTLELVQENLMTDKY